MTRLRPTEIGLAIASMALLVMLLHVAIAVIGRNVLSLEPSGMIEMVSNWWMITIFFLGLASSYVRGDQIRISALVDGAGPRSKAIGNRAIAVLSASALVVLTYYSGRAGLASMLIQERTFGVVALPVWPFKLLIPIGFLLSLGCVLRDLIFGTWDGPMPADNAKTNHAVFNILLLAVWAAALVVGVVMLTFSLSNLAIGILGIVLMLALMMMGVPVAISMIAAGLLGILKIAGLGAFEATIMRAPFGAAASWSLSVLPMFILMGLIMWRSGFTARVFDIFQRLFGFLPGGLAVTTNFAGAALASASGSSAAISYALGRIAIPEMLKRGYQPSLATGVVVMAGVIGNLIPPSIVLIVYAGVAQTPIGPQLLAAVIPGIMISCSYGALIIIRCKLNPALAPRGEVVPTSWGTKLRLVSQLWGLPLIIALVLGSIYSGWATATEAGALGALGAAFVGYLEVRNRIAFGLGVKEALMEAVSSFSAIMFLFIGVAVLTRMIALSGVALFISEGVIGMNLPPLQLIFLLMVVYLILGTFLDTMAIILLTVPLFTATLAAAQIDMLWFGVFVTIMAELAVVTPPLGVLAFIVYRMAQKPEVNMGKTISLTDVFIGCSWFLGATLLCIVALIMFPGLALWLPGKG